MRLSGCDADAVFVCYCGLENRGNPTLERQVSPFTITVDTSILVATSQDKTRVGQLLWLYWPELELQVQAVGSEQVIRGYYTIRGR